jgi:hypothetical protein
MMYLLEFLAKAFVGEKRSLALTLLHDPLGCDPTTLRNWIDENTCATFLLIQRQCKRDLCRRKSNLPGLEASGMSIGVTHVMPSGDECVNEHLTRQLISQLHGQIREDLWRKGECFDDLPVKARVSLTLLYAVSELLFWLLFGVLREANGRYLLTDDVRILEGCRLYFLGHQLAMESHFADAVDQAHLLEIAKRDKTSISVMLRNCPAILKTFTDKSLDKCFSCHPDYVHMLQTSDRSRFEVLHRRAQLICYLFLCSQEELAQAVERDRDIVANPTFITSLTIESLIGAGFQREDIELLIFLSGKADPGEKLLQPTDDGRLEVGNLGLKYALVAYSKEFFRSNVAFGTWFEKGYIKNYLRDRIAESRYATLEGFKSASDETIKYDVDALLLDRKFCRLYFIQIKHRRGTALPYLRDELREFRARHPFGKAVKQLRGVRDNLDSEKLLDRIKSSFRRDGLSPRLVTTDWLRNHCGFLIVHSVENFDFGVKDGIAMYEWNTFRNLLKGEMIQYVGRVSHPVCTDIGGPPLDDPRRVADAIISWLDSQSRSADQPSFSEKLRIKESVHYNILSTRVLRIFGRWGIIRPFLKLKFPVI